MSPPRNKSGRQTGGRSAGFGVAGSLVLLLCCGRTGAGEPAPAGIAPGSTILLTGSIDQAMLDYFNQQLQKSAATTVMIASPGGDERIAMQIAEAMQARGMDVVVHGLCLGTCAQYIFIAGHGRRIEDQALVTFGNSASGMASLLDVVGENAPRDFQPSTAWRDFVVLEKRMYQQAGVSQSFPLDVQAAMQPSCITFTRNEGKLGGIEVATSYKQWLPARQYLDSIGIRFEGYWPRSRREMERIANRLSATRDKSELATLIRFGNEDRPREAGEARFELKNLQKCALEDVGRPPVPVDGAAGN
ncbi:MAG: hypothetical protein WDO12_12365 [Pseudomonadota bacterium]